MTESFFLSCEELSVTARCCSLSSVSISIPLSPISLYHSFTHAFTQQTFRDALCASLPGDTGTAESHKNQWPPPLSEPALFLFLPSQPNLSMEICSPLALHGRGLFGSPETSMLSNPTVFWFSPYSAFRQPSTWPPPSSSCISGFPPTFYLSGMNRSFFLPQCLYKQGCSQGPY